MGGIPHEPPRCASCNAVLALDELEAAGAAWAARQNFAGWSCVPDDDLIEALESATFVALHPSFADGCLCPNCRCPFSWTEAIASFGELADVDPFTDMEDPF